MGDSNEGEPMLLLKCQLDSQLNRSEKTPVIKSIRNPCVTHLNQKIRLDSIWEWFRPFCSQSQVGSLKELKPVFVQRSD